MRRRDDEGQVSLLLVGYAVVVLALVLVVTEATSVHLARHRLLAVADSAALDAADALDAARFYSLGGAGPPDRVVALSDASVRESVAAYLAASREPAALGEVRVADPTGSPDGATAEVSLTASVRLPFVSAVLSRDAVTVRVTARARARQA